MKVNLPREECVQACEKGMFDWWRSLCLGLHKIKQLLGEICLLHGRSYGATMLPIKSNVLGQF
jgi:hypothetical protein